MTVVIKQKKVNLSTGKKVRKLLTSLRDKRNEIQAFREEHKDVINTWSELVKDESGIVETVKAAAKAEAGILTDKTDLYSHAGQVVTAAPRRTVDAELLIELVPEVADVAETRTVITLAELDRLHAAGVVKKKHLKKCVKYGVPSITVTFAVVEDEDDD